MDYIQTVVFAEVERAVRLAIEDIVIRQRIDSLVNEFMAQHNASGKNWNNFATFLGKRAKAFFAEHAPQWDVSVQEHGLSFTAVLFLVRDRNRPGRSPFVSGGTYSEMLRYDGSGKLTWDAALQNERRAREQHDREYLERILQSDLRQKVDEFNEALTRLRRLTHDIVGARPATHPDGFSQGVWPLTSFFQSYELQVQHKDKPVGFDYRSNNMPYK